MNGTELIHNDCVFNKGKKGFHGNMKKGDTFYMRASGTNNFVEIVVDKAAKFKTIKSMSDRQYIIVSQKIDSSKKYKLKRRDFLNFSGKGEYSKLAVFSSPSDPRFPVLSPVSFYKLIPGKTVSL